MEAAVRQAVHGRGAARSRPRPSRRRARSTLATARSIRTGSGPSSAAISCRSIGVAGARQIGATWRRRPSVFGQVEQAREVDAPRLPMARPPARRRAGRLRPIISSTRAEAERGHDLAQLLGDEEEIVDHMLGRAGEAGAQHRILGGDADRAGVEMALAHHDAAGGDQRRGGEAEFVGAEHRGDGDVAAGAAGRRRPGRRSARAGR